MGGVIGRQSLTFEIHVPGNRICSVVRYLLHRLIDFFCLEGTRHAESIVFPESGVLLFPDDGDGLLFADGPG